jgi:hypothetical protein
MKLGCDHVEFKSGLIKFLDTIRAVRATAEKAARSI